MVIDETTASPKQRNDEDYNFPTGVYTTRLVDVAELPPRADDERKTPRLVFEFEVVEGPYKGKKTATFVKKNLFAGGGSRNAKPSALYKLAKSLGVIDPMVRWDTTQFIGKHYTVVVKNDSDRAWPESILPTSAPAGAAPGSLASAPAAPTAPRPPAPPASAEPADESRWQWCADGVTWQSGTGKDFREWLMDKGADPAAVHATPENANAVKRASEYGFKIPPF